MRFLKVRTSLLLALGILTGLLIAESLSGVAVTQYLFQRQKNISETLLPSTIGAKSLYADTINMASLMAELDQAQSKEQIASLQQKTSFLVEKISEELVLLSKYSGGIGEIEEIEPIIENASINLDEYLSATYQRVELYKKRQESTQNILSDIAAMSDLTDTLIANSRGRISNVLSTIYDKAESPDAADSIYETLDNLLDFDLFDAEQMVNLQINCLRLNRQVVAMGGATSVKKIGTIQEKVEQILKDLSRNVAAIPDPHRQKQGVEILERLVAERDRSREDGLYRLNIAYLKNNIFMEEIKSYYWEVAAGLEKSASSAAENFTSQMIKSQESMSSISTLFKDFMLALSIITIFLSIGFAYFYVHRNVLSRLAVLSATTKKLSTGDMNVSIPEAYDDELGELAHALSIFSSEND